jgi:phosphoribosylanthranilate isomerase
MTKIQIYTIQSVEEALELADLGVDHIGVTPASRGLPGEIDIKTAYSICKSVKDSLVTVALSVESDINLILSMVKEVKPQILHLCSPEGFITPQSIRDLKEKLYTNNIDIEIMQAISVKGFESVENAISYVEEVDYLILDTQSKDVYGIGASGDTHDWNVSKEIVNSVDIPVILAGGLSPENVTDAIRHVKPWGVDSLTHTNKPLPGGGFVKDIEKVKSFVSASRHG